MIYRLVAVMMLLGVVSFIAVGILDCQMKERKARAQSIGQAMSPEDRTKFDPIVKKHGLQYDIAIIYDWPGPNAYFIDKRGRRIKFK